MVTKVLSEGKGIIARWCLKEVGVQGYEPSLWGPTGLPSPGAVRTSFRLTARKIQRNKGKQTGEEENLSLPD